MSKPSFKFVADAVSLDFLNSLPRLGNGEDTIADGDGFMRWIEQAELIPRGAIDPLRAELVPGEIDAVAEQARALGEWFRGFVHEFKGHSLPATAIDRLHPLNQILENDIKTSKVDARDDIEDRIAGSGLKWTSERAYRSPEMLLLPIAQAMAELVCVADFSEIKCCEAPGCDLLFLDRTHRGARRWCSMAVCGNRVKQANRRNAMDQ